MAQKRTSRPKPISSQLFCYYLEDVEHKSDSQCPFLNNRGKNSAGSVKNAGPSKKRFASKQKKANVSTIVFGRAP